MTPAGAGAGDIGRLGSLKTERMIYLQIRLELQLYTLALMGYTFYLSSVKT